MGFVHTKIEEFEHLDDGALWLKVNGGDKDALAFIYKRYFPRLFNYGMKLLPDADILKDHIHDLFVKLWQDRKKLLITSSIKHYLFTCLKRSIIVHLKQERKLQVILDKDPFEAIPSPEDDLILDTALREKRRKLLDIVNKLPSRQKEILFLRYYEGLSTREVAEVMSLTVNSIYVMLSRAIDFMKKNSKHLFMILQIFCF